jgi:hypothetical protein
MNLSQQTVLCCAPNLDLRLDSSNQVQIIVGDRSVTCGSHSLLVLDAFARPRPLGDALADLRANVVGMQDWIDLTTVVGQLYEARVIQAENHIPDRWPDISLYTSIEETIAAHNDEGRVRNVLMAIRETIRPGDVVIDLNGGPGIFAIASALAGASMVYMIESGSYGPLAQAAFRANGVADRIELLNSLPTPEELAAPADVLIADVTCNDVIFSDHRLGANHLGRGLLKPGARTLPNRLQLWALPVTIPNAELQRNTFTADVVMNWKSWYGIDFTQFAEVAARSALLYPLHLHAARSWPTLADPVMLVETELLGLDALRRAVSVPIHATAAGLFNGVVLYLEVEYSQSVKLSSPPSQVEPNSYNYGFYWALDRAIEAQPGDQFSLWYGREPLSNDFRISVSQL